MLCIVLLVDTSMPQQQCWHAEENLAIKVGGEENLERLQDLKSLVDPDNMFKNHQLRGLTPT